MNRNRLWFDSILILAFAWILSLPLFSSPLSFAYAQESPHRPLSKSGHSFSEPVPMDDVVKKGDSGYVKANSRTVSNPLHSRIASDPRGNRPDPRYMDQESIIGNDDRTKVENTVQYPYSAIAHIESDIGGCTGWFIDADTLVTAGHCVYDPESQRWASWATVYPGRNGEHLPYGSAEAVEFFTVQGWADGGDINYDYGAIQIDRPLGQATGWFGISGYPGDKEYGTQWQHHDQVRETTSHKLHYANDTFGGQSGSPVFIENDPVCGACGIAIHTNGVFGDSPYNRGTRITEDVFKNFQLWKAQ